MASKITIDGKTYTSEGSNIDITDGKIFIDGKEITQIKSKNITIKIEGDLMNLTVEHFRRNNE